jgi:hypothetical protein
LSAAGSQIDAGLTTKKHDWLVVSTHLKNINQLGLLFPIYGKRKMFQTTNQMT